MQVGLTLGREQRRTAEQAREAEEQGFDLIAAGEHLFFHGPVSNGLISLAAAAGATKRIRLMSALTLVAQYQPAMLAKLVTTLDQVSDGRLDFDVMIPAKQVTSLTFAGADLDRLFVTTAAQPPVDADDPHAGTLWEVPKSLLRGHKGLPTNAFAG